MDWDSSRAGTAVQEVCSDVGSDLGRGRIEMESRICTAPIDRARIYLQDLDLTKQAATKVGPYDEV